MSQFASDAWPMPKPAGFQPGDPGSPLITFYVSLNEEHVVVGIDHGGKTSYLGERSHHCSLLALARLRLFDASRRIDRSSQGWVDTIQLSNSLGIDEAHLNIHVFRARKSFALAMAGVDGLPAIVERRRCEMRFGAYRFRIVRGDEIEGTFPPSPAGHASAGADHATVAGDDTEEPVQIGSARP